MTLASRRGARPGSLVALILAIGGVLSSPPSPLPAATPSSGTVSSSSPTVSWCGFSACGAPQTSVTSNLLAPSCSNSTCETFTLTVGAASATDIVRIGISWTNPVNDFDLHVFKADGTPVASSAGGAPGTTEQVTIPAVAGTYSVQVLLYTVAGEDYSGTAELQAGPTPRTATYLSGGITFSPSVTVKAPVAARDGEPSNRVDFTGNAYVSGIRGVPAGVDLWFFDLAQASGTFDPQLRHPAYRGQPDSFPLADVADVGADGGGDVDLAVGFSNPTNPASAVPNLTAVSLVAANISSSRSQDRGVTFMKDPAASVIPADDRQWLEALGGDVEFLLYRAPIPATGLFVQTSLDGGFSYPVTSSVNVSGTTPGYIAVDQASNVQSKHFVYAGHSSSSAMFVSRAEFDPGNTLSPMLFRRFTVDNTTSHRHLFDVVKVGQDGTVYACWSDDKNVYLSHSTDSGQSWATKVQVNDPGFTVTDRLGSPQTVKTNLFPWCAAGSAGRVDVVWYGTTEATNNDNADWNVFFAQSVNATDTSPTFRQVKASDHFIHAGNVSEGGLTGAANRNLLDYFQVALDPQGAAFVAFTDDHNDFDGHTYVTRQLDGPSAFANANGNGMVVPVAPSPPPPAPAGPQVTDFNHDAVAGLLATIPTDHPLDIRSIQYGCEAATDGRRLVTATMRVSDLGSIPAAANWRMNLTANAPASLADRGDQFFLRASTDTLTPTFTYGTTQRNSDGSLTNTTRGSADAGFFDATNKLVTVKVDVAKLNVFASTPIATGTAFIGLRGSTFTTGVNASRRGSTTWNVPVPIAARTARDTCARVWWTKRGGVPRAAMCVCAMSVSATKPG